jgi:integrase/recombinase XerD
MAMQFEVVLKSFLDHLRIEKGLSPNSITAYDRDLRKFALFINSESLEYSSLTEEDISRYEASLKGLDLSSASINRAISALKSFYLYLGIEYEIANPMQAVERRKLTRKLPKALTVSEITSLIDATKRLDNPISLRDFALLELLYGTGARVSEVIGINLNDIASSTDDQSAVSTVKLRGKGSKERIVPIGSYAMKALSEYLTRTRPALAEKSKQKNANAALFLNSRGTRLSRVSAWQIVSDAADATGLRGKISPHVFRHSYATHLLDGGADIRVVQELLGHASVTTTQIYTLVTIDKVREAYANAHPRAR